MNLPTKLYLGIAGPVFPIALIVNLLNNNHKNPKTRKPENPKGGLGLKGEEKPKL
jgi:hypothetical protein